jgi:hypothetical protein
LRVPVWPNRLIDLETAGLGCAGMQVDLNDITAAHLTRAAFALR